MIVVTNSTPIISLAKIDKLHLLRDIFGKIYVPNAVYKEVVLKGKGRPGSKEIEEAEWVESKEVYNIISKKHLLAYLDEGEAEVILLADELSASLVIMDERKGYEVLSNLLNIKVIGTIAILSMAKDLGLVENIKPYLDKMKANGVWIDDQIYAISLKDVNELP
jgi:predicted nucleic acid-binding protein